MPDIRGREITILIGDGGGPPEVYSIIAKATVHEWTIDNSEEEVNTKDSQGWRDLFPPGSIKSVEATMTVLFDNSSDQARLRSIALSNDPQASFKLRDKSGTDLLGDFQVRDYRVLGETNGFAQVNVTLSSSGVVSEVAEA